MRIGLLFDGPSLPPKDGVTYRTYHIAKQLSAYRPDVEIICFFGDRGWTSDAQLMEEGLKCELFPASWLYNENLPKVAAIIKRQKIDIMHICNSHPVVLLFGKTLAHAAGVPLVVDMHDVDHHLYKSLGKSQAEIKEARILQRITADCADAIISMSSLDHTQLQTLGIAQDKLHYIPHGITMQQPFDFAARNHNEILFIGNLFYQPNYNAALCIANTIAPAVRAQLPNAKFTIIGRTPKELLQIQRPGVSFIGEQDDITPFMQRAGLGIAPLFEGSGMKVKMITYASYGLPVIGSPVALMGYESTSSFIKASSPTGFIKQIIQGLKHPDKLALTGQQLYTEVGQQFSWKAVIDRLYSVYAAILKPSPQTPVTKRTLSNRDAPKILSVRPVPLPLWLTEKRFQNQNSVTGVPRRINQGTVEYA